MKTGNNRKENIKNILAIIGIMAISIFIAIVFTQTFLTDDPDPIPTSQLPVGYKVISSIWAENAEGEMELDTVKIFAPVWSGGIQTSPYLFDVGDLEIFTIDDNPPRLLWENNVIPMEKKEENVSALILYERKEGSIAVWTIYLFKEEKEWSILWETYLSRGKTVTLPTGEVIAFTDDGFNFSENGPPDLYYHYRYR